MFNTKILTSLALGAHLNSHGFHGLCPWCIFFMGIFRCRLHSHGVYIFSRCSNGERWERAHNFPRKKKSQVQSLRGVKNSEDCRFLSKIFPKKIAPNIRFSLIFPWNVVEQKYPDAWTKRI